MVSETPDSSPPLLQPAIRRDLTSTARGTRSKSDLNASAPLPSSSTQPLGFNLWASEPSLRFPLPQGDQGLADWLSSSHPNIMLSDPSDDAAALADSMLESFEIISANNTDTEDQDDGYYPASISESIASLDVSRPDDVHSLAGTDRTYDEEESVPDTDSYRAETPFEDDDDGAFIHGNRRRNQEDVNADDDDADDDDDYDYEKRNNGTSNDNKNKNKNKNSSSSSSGSGSGSSGRSIASASVNIDKSTAHAHNTVNARTVVNPNDISDADDAEDIHDSTFVQSQTSDTTAVESLPDSDDADDGSYEALSSLHYTHQSLGTPSLPTPEASRIFDRLFEEPLGPPGFQESWSKQINKFWEIEGQIKDYCTELGSAALPGMMFVLIFALVLQLANTSDKPLSPIPEATPVVATLTTTETFTTTATATTTFSVATASPQPTSAPTSAFGLIPVGTVVSDDWLFGASKPVVSFTAQSQHGILVRIPAKIKKTWHARGCLTLTAKRGDDLVDTFMSSVDEGIVVKFSRKEVHGVITLILEATCRPKVHKVVKVHFSRGLVEGALELTRNLAQDLSKLVPATAQEAERRLGDARRSFDSVCQNVCVNLQSASETVAETVAKTFGTSLSETRQNLEEMASEARAQVKAAQRQVSEQLSRVQDLQDTFQLYLLDAQISAKLWWLQTTGRRDKHDDYQRKAESFVAQKQAAAREHRGLCSSGSPGSEENSRPLSWWARRKLGAS